MEEAPEILGVPEIDAGHQKITELLDRLHGIVDGVPDNESLLATIAELVDVFCDQITYEEDAMRTILHNEAKAHRRNHDEFIKMMSTLLFDYQTNNLRITADTTAMIKAWKFNHISTFDKPLAEALRRRASKKG